MSSPPDSDRSLPAPDKTYRKFLPGIRNHRTPSFSPPGTPPSPPSSPPPEISPPAASKSTVPSKPVFKHPGDRISLEDCSDSGNRTDCANRPGLDHIYLKDQIHAWLRTVYKRLETDLDFIFHSTEVEPLCLSLAGSVHDFYRILELFARYPFRTITFSEEEEGKGRIDFEFKMSVTPLHSAVPKWASETFTDMIRGKFRGDDTFFTWEEAGLMVQGSWGSDLPTNLHREDSPEAEEEEEGEGRRTLKKKKMTKKQKKMAEMFKTADHIYCYDENEYPSIVFEVGWSEQMGDLRRDAQQWLCRTNSAKCKNKHDGKQWKHGKEKQHGKSRQRGTKKQCSTTPGVNVVILVKIEECKDPLLVERERKRRAIVEEQDDYPDNVIGDVDKEDLDLLATIEDDKLAGWLSDDADDGWSSGDDHDEQQSSDDEEQQPSDDEDEDMTNDANSLPSTSAAPDTDDDNCMQIDSDMEEYDYRSPSPSPSRSFASNCESTVETFSVAKRKIKTSHWVGSISAVLELWRWDPKRKIPFSSARRIVLPRNNATNDIPMTLSKHEVFPYVRPGEDRHKKFELDMEQLRRRLEKAMHRYAFQRCLQWRRKLLDRRHGKNWRDEYVRDKRAQLGMD